MTEAELKRVRYYAKRLRGECTSCPNKAERSLCTVCAEKNLRRVTERLKRRRADIIAPELVGSDRSAVADPVAA